MPLHSVASTALVFVSTNLDDMVVVATFFATPGMRREAVVIGQLLGLGAIIAISVAAAYLMLPVPQAWTALLGVVPLLLGIWRLQGLRRVKKHAVKASRGGAGQATTQAATQATTAPAPQKPQGTFLSQLAMVTLVTVANGGDNLSAYIPLFAGDVDVIPLYVATLLPFTALWCLLGYGLVRNPMGVAAIERWGHVILPLVLIAVGIHVLLGARPLFA